MNSVVVKSENPGTFCASVSNLHPDTAHEVVLRACSADGCGVSDSSQAVTACAPPVGLSARLSRAGSDSLTIEAVAVGGQDIEACRATRLAVGLRLAAAVVDDAGESGDGSGEGEDAGFDVIVPIPVGSRTVNLPDLSPLVRYGVAIVATNPAGVAQGLVQVYQTLAVPPEGVAAPRVTTVDNGEGGVALQWLPPTHPFVGSDETLLYDLLLDGEVHTEATKHLLVVVSGLPPFTNHRVQLKACNAVGCTLSAETTFVTPAAAPSAVRSPTVSGVQARGMTVSWTRPVQPNGPLLSYALELQRCDDSGDVVLCVDDAGPAYEGPSSTTVVSLDGLQPYTLYQLRVAATTAGGTTLSPWTASFLFQCQGCSGPVLNRLRTLPADPELAGPVACGPADVDAIACDWAGAFRLNGPLLRYRVAVLPAGPSGQVSAAEGATQFTLDGIVGTGAALTVEVQAITALGSVTQTTAVVLPLQPTTIPPVPPTSTTTAAAGVVGSSRDDEAGGGVLASTSVVGIAVGAVILLLLLLLLVTQRRRLGGGGGKARVLPFWVAEHNGMVSFGPAVTGPAVVASCSVGFLVWGLCVSGVHSVVPSPSLPLNTGACPRR